MFFDVFVGLRRHCRNVGGSEVPRLRRRVGMALGVSRAELPIQVAKRKARRRRQEADSGERVVVRFLFQICSCAP